MEARSTEWNLLVQREPGFSMLQSWEWGAIKQKLGWKAFRVAVEDTGTLLAGAQLLIKPLPLGLSLAYVPRGPVGNWLNAETAPLLFTELCRLARSEGAVFLNQRGTAFGAIVEAEGLGAVTVREVIGGGRDTGDGHWIIVEPETLNQGLWKTACEKP